MTDSLQTKAWLLS